MEPTSARPLVLSADPVLVEELVRLAAAAGVDPEVVGDVGGALGSWSAAALVLVGVDLAEAVAEAAPHRRPGVHLVTAGVESDALYRVALACAAESVRCLPAAAPEVVRDLTDCDDRARAPGSPGPVVGVIGGAGGAGATVFAAALAEVLAGSRDVLLVDADRWGPGIDRVLGTEAFPGVRWDGIAQTAGRLSARSLYDALPRRGRLSVLSWPPGPPAAAEAGLSPAALRAAISAGRRAFGITVLDLPRHRDPVVEDLVLRCDQVLVVLPMTVPAVASAARLTERLPPGAQLVLRGSGAGVPVAEIGRVLGLGVRTRMRDQRGLDEAIALGLGPLRSRRGPLARAAQEAAAGVSQQ